MKMSPIQSAECLIRLTVGAITAMKILAQLRQQKIVVARTRKQHAAVEKMIAASENFERELALLMEHGEGVEEPPEDFLRELRRFQISYNDALATGWRL